MSASSILLVFLSIAFGLLPLPTIAKEFKDSTVDLTSTYQGFNPHIATSGNNVYVVWQNGTQVSEYSNLLYKRSTDGGNTFGNVIKLSDHGNFKYPNIAASGSNVYVVYDNVLKRSTDNGLTFSSMLGRVGWGYIPYLAAFGNNLYLLTQTSPTARLLMNIAFEKSTDGGNSFGHRTILDECCISDPSIVVSGNNVYAVWKNYSPQAKNVGINFARSTDGGNSFGSHVVLGGPELIDPRLAVTGNNVYVVWARGDGNPSAFLRTSTDNGTSFRPEVKINDKDVAVFPGIAAAGNNVYLLDLHYTRGGPIVSLIRSADNGTISGMYHVATFSGGEDIHSPHIDVTGNRVYVLWQQSGIIRIFSLLR